MRGILLSDYVYFAVCALVLEQCFCVVWLVTGLWWPVAFRNKPAFRRPGGHSEETSPDPISNSAVKLLSANGTKSQGLGE